MTDQAPRTAYTGPRCGNVCGIPKDAHQNEEHPWEAEAALAAESRVAALEAAVNALESYGTDDHWDPDGTHRDVEVISRESVLALLAGDKAEAPLVDRDWPIAARNRDAVHIATEAGDKAEAPE